MRKIIIAILILIPVAGCLLLGWINVLAPSVRADSENVSIYIPTGSGAKELDSILKKELRHTMFLSPMIRWVAENRYPVRSGKFTLQAGMNNYQVLKRVFTEGEDEIQLAFNSLKDISDLAALASDKIEADSASIMSFMTDEKFLDSIGVNRQSARALFIPNTYNFYWDTSAEEFVRRMLREYDKFWDTDRLDKAKKLGLSPIQISTLAAIVQSETPKADEQPIVAGLYINRIKHGIPLQSDPTVIYAKRETQNVTEPIRRVYLKDLKIDSPFNTYKYKGLPPAPIVIPTSQAVDAVLNYSKHNYLYMCASVSRFGYHEFAADLKAHSKNRAKYIKWLNEKNIK